MNKSLQVLLTGVLASAAMAVAAQDAPVRNSRHALIIGIGEYRNASTSVLAGVKYDVESARLMAQKMAIPDENMVFLRDTEATADRIRKELKALNSRVEPGDRVFIYYTGHGTRWFAPTVNTEDCTEGILAADGRALTNVEIGALLKPVASKTDKMMVFYDACFSGGVVGAPLRTRSVKLGEQIFTPKFSAAGSPEQCSKPANFRTRSLSAVVQQNVGLPENIVHVAASKSDEVSFDNPQRGGFATTAWRDCFLNEARDLDGSGAITVDEITQCAQNKLDKAFAGHPDIAGQHMVLGGNKSFIPVHFAADRPQQEMPAPVPLGSAIVPGDQPVAQPEVQVVAKPFQVLDEIHQQRDARIGISAKALKDKVRIGQDALALQLTSQVDGYLYIALAGSDNQSLYLLYPNDLARNNRVSAGQTLVLPDKDWQIYAGGPAGQDKLLVIVTESPRDLERLKGEKVGPFMQTLMDSDGRAQLQSLLTNSANAASAECQKTSNRRNLQITRRCTDSFGSAQVTITEQ